MQKTNLNVSPYYDDFDTTDNFHRVLFRPGFAVQARELTQLQSILQNQIEKFGTHMFKEGAMVIPGQVGFTNEYYAVKLQSTFNSNPVSGYVNDYIGKTITGATSGVKATVIGFESATTTDPLTLYVKYTQTGTDNVSTVFSDNEQIQADGAVGGLVAGSSSAQLQASSATATGSSANIEEGVYFVRGQFVRVTPQRIVLDKYTDTPSYRIGLGITETLITPEADTSLLDNATGSSNVNAKGAHRLKITLTLSKLPIGSAEDTNFIELIRVTNGRIQEKTRNTEYSVLGETLARRTFDESGDYSVRPFGVDVRESLDDGLNEGVYASGTTTDQGATTGENLMTIQVSPGKAYVRGYEIETVSPTFLDLPKPRTTDNFDSAITNIEVGNFTRVTNVFGSPDLSPFISGEVAEPYRSIELHSIKNASRGATPNQLIEYADVPSFPRNMDHNKIALGLKNPPVDHWQRPLDTDRISKLRIKIDSAIQRNASKDSLMANPVLIGRSNKLGVDGVDIEIKPVTVNEPGRPDQQVPNLYSLKLSYVGDKKPLWILDGQHRIHGLGNSPFINDQHGNQIPNGSIVADETIPVVFVVDEERYNAKFLAKIFTEVTTEAVKMDELHGDWMQYSFEMFLNTVFFL